MCNGVFHRTTKNYHTANLEDTRGSISARVGYYRSLHRLPRRSNDESNLLFDFCYLRRPEMTIPAR